MENNYLNEETKKQFGNFGFDVSIKALQMMKDVFNGSETPNNENKKEPPEVITVSTKEENTKKKKKDNLLKQKYTQKTKCMEIIRNLITSKCIDPEKGFELTGKYCGMIKVNNDLTTNIDDIVKQINKDKTIK